MSNMCRNERRQKERWFFACLYVQWSIWHPLRSRSTIYAWSSPGFALGCSPFPQLSWRGPCRCRRLSSHVQPHPCHSGQKMRSFFLVREYHILPGQNKCSLSVSLTTVSFSFSIVLLNEIVAERDQFTRANNAPHNQPSFCPALVFLS